MLRPICGWWSDEARRRQLVKFIPFMARCKAPGWGTGNLSLSLISSYLGAER